jgi:hypothetical protein
MNSRLISATVSAIRPGSGGGCSSAVVGEDRDWRTGFRVCGGDRADGERGHGEHDMPQMGGVEPNLGMVESEVVFGELKPLLDRPTQTRHPHQRHHRDRPPEGAHSSSGRPTRQ